MSVYDRVLQVPTLRTSLLRMSCPRGWLGSGRSREAGRSKEAGRSRVAWLAEYVQKGMVILSHRNSFKSASTSEDFLKNLTQFII